MVDLGKWSRFWQASSESWKHCHNGSYSRIHRFCMEIAHDLISTITWTEVSLHSSIFAAWVLITWECPKIDRMTSDKSSMNSMSCLNDIWIEIWNPQKMLLIFTCVHCRLSGQREHFCWWLWIRLPLSCSPWEPPVNIKERRNNQNSIRSKEISMRHIDTAVYLHQGVAPRIFVGGNQG